MNKSEIQKRWRYNKGISKRPQLTDGEKSVIRELRADGHTYQQIAQIMNRSIECIARILKNK